jgi:succinyl-CoA synthetase alpha subunit
VIIELGGRKITGLDDFDLALRHFNADDTVDVTALRRQAGETESDAGRAALSDAAAVALSRSAGTRLACDEHGRVGRAR